MIPDQTHTVWVILALVRCWIIAAKNIRLLKVTFEKLKIHQNLGEKFAISAKCASTFTIWDIFKWVNLELWICKNFKIVTNEVLKYICSKLLTNTNYIRRTCLHPYQTNICILNKFLKWLCGSLPVHNDDSFALHLFQHRFVYTVVLESNVYFYYITKTDFLILRIQ